MSRLPCSTTGKNPADPMILDRRWGLYFAAQPDGRYGAGTCKPHRNPSGWGSDLADLCNTAGCGWDGLRHW